MNIILLGRDGIVMSYQDLVEYEQEAVRVITDKEKIALFREKGYNSVLSALRSGPLTVKEITEHANLIVEKIVGPEIERKLDKDIFKESSEESILTILRKVSLTAKELFKLEEKKKELKISKSDEEAYKFLEKQIKFQSFVSDLKEKVKKKKSFSKEDNIKLKTQAKSFLIEKHKRSDKTIYRYLKDLTKQGLIAQAGQRVVFGKTATETLFCRAAKIFLLQIEDKSWWTCDEAKKQLEIISKVFTLTHNKTLPVKCLGKLLRRIEDDTGEKFLEMAKESNNELSRLIKDSSFKDFQMIMDVMRTLNIIMEADSLKKELDECLKS